jgi:hypothetical protein
MQPDRYADLWLTDFSADPEEVVRTFPVLPFLVARKGKPTGLQDDQPNATLSSSGMSLRVPLLGQMPLRP